MVKGQEIIVVKQQVLLHTDLQPTFTATVTDTDGDYFWIGLPKDGNQVLVLQKNQSIKIGVSFPKVFYQSETSVDTLGTAKDRFYKLVIPSTFIESQERKFVRAHHFTNVIFQADNLRAQTALVNFSAGGMMVYLVPELERILQSDKDIKANVTIDNFPFELNVKLTWKKLYDNITFAGFEFINLTPNIQSALAMLSVRYSENWSIYSK